MERDETIEALIATGSTAERVAAVLADLRARLPSERFYVFQARSLGGGGEGTRRPRTLMAFASPDAALLFAQRNSLVNADAPPRLQVLRLPRLLLAMAMAPAIKGVLFISDESDPQPGRTPEGFLIERSALFD